MEGSTPDASRTQEQPDEAQRRREFLERRSRLEDTQKDARTTADKLVVSGAAGALILSITFISNIAHNPLPQTRPWLLGAWILLGLSLLLSFASHFTSEQSFRVGIAQEDAEYGNMKERIDTGLWDKVTLALNYAAPIVLLAGLLCLGVFAFRNTRFQSTTQSEATSDSVLTRVHRIEVSLDSLAKLNGVRPSPPPPPPAHRSN